MNKNYTGIDYFRFIAALLIIAIHTSPLGSFSETGDFMLTRIIARVAVPFFFMTSGFFLISRYAYNNSKLWMFVKKTVLIYGVAMLIYIPINIYNGYFRMDNLLPNIIKDIVFDGTLYHLWYLPASIIGATIAWYLVRKFDYGAALIMTGILYFIGLFGDSYYGLSEKIGILDGFYNLIFQISDHTRNGIFFAPIFFVLGGLIADNRHKIEFRKSICGFSISFVLMFIEALILHFCNLQRHDSMYIFLLPCMYFLFNIILHFKGKRIIWLRTSSLIIYIIHPMMIVIIRLFAKLLHLENLLVDNSIIHYLIVCLSSVAFGIATTVLWNKYRPKKVRYDNDTDRAYIEIDLNNLEHNVKTLRKAMPPKCELMAVVKAQAYGHGAYEISTHLEKIGVRAFAVATIDEGISLRKYGIRGEILILGYTSIDRASELKKYNLIQTLISFEYANALNRQGVMVNAHIKIDTGMHRLGIPSADFLDVEKVFTMKNLNVCGIFTHLCCSDSSMPDDIAFTRGQIDGFYNLIDHLKKSGINIPKLHIQSSYGFLNYPELKCSYVRTGVALYGVKSLPDDNIELQLDLRPVLSLKSRVVLIRQIEKGDSVGYGRSFVAERNSRIAILPIGYGDGFPRSLSNGNGRALIGQYIVPVIGRICMDQLAIDITDAEGIAVGDIATLIDTDGCTDLSADVVAKNSNSISNELLCRMGERLPVIIKRQ